MADTAEKELVHDVSEKLCYIALDYDTELTSTAETNNMTTCEIPDGNIITVGADISIASSIVPAKFTWRRSQRRRSSTFPSATLCTPISSCTRIFVCRVL